MKRLTAALVAVLCASTSFATEWEHVAQANKSKAVYEYKSDSIDAEGSGSGMLATAVFRVVDPTESTKFYKIKVPHLSCRTGYGSVSTYSLSNTLQSQTDYADGGGTVASGIAEFVCNKAWGRALREVVRNTVQEVDYVSHETAAKTFDALLEEVKKDPSHKQRPIDWVVLEAHRLVMVALKKGGT